MLEWEGEQLYSCSRGCRDQFLEDNTYEGYTPCTDENGSKPMSETVTYEVPGIHCEHCEMSIREEVSEIEGVESVDVDLESKAVTIRGRDLDDVSLRAAIEEAGYEAAR